MYNWLTVHSWKDLNGAVSPLTSTPSSLITAASLAPAERNKMLVSTDAQAWQHSEPMGRGKITQRWLCVPWTLPSGDVRLLTCQASSCCERFTFCWIASSSWLLRDIMSILHLASSTSTAFFLGEEQEMGLLTYFFKLFWGNVKHILEEKSTN